MTLSVVSPWPPGRQQAARAASQAAKAARASWGRQRPPGPPVRPPAGRQGRQGRQARPPGHPGRQRPPEAARAAKRAARGSGGLATRSPHGPMSNESRMTGNLVQISLMLDQRKPYFAQGNQMNYSFDFLVQNNGFDGVEPKRSSIPCGSPHGPMSIESREPKKPCANSFDSH